MARIVCGWCHQPTPEGRCEHCGHEAALPWTQRGRKPPIIGGDDSPGRPALDPVVIRHLYDEAKAGLVRQGREPTVEAIAERLDRSPRTVSGWRRRYGLR